MFQSRPSRSRQGGWGFVLIELEVEVSTDPDRETVAERAAKLAEERCVVGRSIRIPLEVGVVVGSPTEEAVAA
jgi:hypothetical protein